jgi:hypothetical protein
LENNEFRLVSYYETEKQRLWLSLDRDTLRRALAQTAKSDAGAGASSKLAARFDPAWLWLHGRISFGDEAKRYIEKYGRDLRSYRSGQLTAVPLGPNQGLRLHVRLDN